MEPNEVDAAIDDLEKKLERLRALYEQYFLGIEKLEPTIPRRDVDRLLYQLRKIRITKTVTRFRFQQQVQRYNTLSTYWTRVIRQIEEGTYRRTLMTNQQAGAAGRVEAKGESDLPSHEIDLAEIDGGGDTTDHSIALPENEPTNPAMVVSPPVAAQYRDETDPELRLPEAGSPLQIIDRPDPKAGARFVLPRPGEGARRGMPARSPRTASDAKGLSDDRIQAIYERYVAARRQCNEPVTGLSLEKVRSQLLSREQALLEKHGKAVDFEVTVKDGRAVLRAKPRGE
jgi:hypothetical protein